MSAIFQAITISDSPLALSLVSCSSTALALFIVFLPLGQGGQADDGEAQADDDSDDHRNDGPHGLTSKGKAARIAPAAGCQFT